MFLYVLVGLFFVILMIYINVYYYIYINDWKFFLEIDFVLGGLGWGLRVYIFNKFLGKLIFGFIYYVSNMIIEKKLCLLK